MTPEPGNAYNVPEDNQESDSIEGRFGIGVDIESIVRFAGQERDSRLLQRIFTAGELDYCFSARLPAPHLTARFAAKEAIIKALSSLGEKKPAYSDIEIRNSPEGVPLASVKGASTTGLQVQLSLSHCEDKAIAFAVITRILD